MMPRTFCRPWDLRETSEIRALLDSFSRAIFLAKSKLGRQRLEPEASSCQIASVEYKVTPESLGSTVP